MKLVILAVGKGRKTPEQSLTADWLARIQSGADLLEVESRLPPGDSRQIDEGERLLRHLPAGAPLVACDPYGRDTSSEELAALIGQWRDEGNAAAYFAVGGADGHATAVKERASRILCFGRATWPHMLFRAMLAEQLYRATTILSGHPYHRS